MPDVLIRHLRVRLVRKGALFWRGDARGLARRALFTLPRWVERQLEEEGLGEQALQLEQPVRVVLRGSLAALQALLCEETPPPALREQLRSALAQALGAARQEGAPVPERRRPLPARAPEPGVEPLDDLLQLHLQGALRSHLARMPLALLEAYHHTLLERPPPAGAPTWPLSAHELQEVERQLESLASRAALAAGEGRRARLEARLAAVVELAASSGVSAFSPQVRALVERLLPLSTHGAQAHSAPPSTSEGLEGGSPLGELLRLYLGGSLASHLASLPLERLRDCHRALLEQPPPGGAPARGLSREELREVEQGLTALVSAQRPGQQAPEERARLEERLAAAVGLAASCGVAPFSPQVRALINQQLPVVPVPAGPGRASPPAAPWRPGSSRAVPRARSTASESTEPLVPILPFLVATLLERAGVVARVERHLVGLGAPEELPLWVAALAFQLGPPPVRGWLYPREVWAQAALLSGSELFSGEGLARLADAPSARWAELTVELAGQLAPAGASLVAAPLGSGVALVTSAPVALVWAGPASNRELRRGAGGRPMVRHPLLAADLLPEVGACAPAALAEEVQEALQVLEPRKACPLARHPEFDWHLGAVAGWALAQVGAALWPDESPPALLAFERFASLEVRVQREEQGLCLWVPLGKRFEDLSRAGLLAQAERLPWLFGGTIRFQGG